MPGPSGFVWKLRYKITPKTDRRVGSKGDKKLIRKLTKSRFEDRQKVVPKGRKKVTRKQPKRPETVWRFGSKTGWCFGPKMSKCFGPKMSKCFRPENGIVGWAPHRCGRTRYRCGPRHWTHACRCASSSCVQVVITHAQNRSGKKSGFFCIVANRITFYRRGAPRGGMVELG